MILSPLILASGLLAAQAAIPRGELAWNPAALAEGGKAQSVVVRDGTLELLPKAGLFPAQGSFNSPVLPLAFDADYCGVLLEAESPAGGSLLISIRFMAPDGGWGPWRKLDHFERLADFNETPAEKKKYLSQGPLMETKGIRALQWKVELSSSDGKATPRVREIRIPYARVRNR